ncbi:MAG: septum formation initiator family protein [Candidatus Omnitrophica bacterium]|nr:septum formation initiator family protein [Candidatus Omnitrophota bacterium]
MLPSKKRIISAFVCFIILSLIFAPGFSKLQQIREQNRLLLQEIERLKKENADLKEQERRYQEDFYIEKLARETLKMGRKGEVIYKINSDYSDEEQRLQR